MERRRLNPRASPARRISPCRLLYASRRAGRRAASRRSCPSRARRSRCGARSRRAARNAARRVRPPGGMHIRPSMARPCVSRQRRRKSSASCGRTPAFCGSAPVLTSTNRRGRRPVLAMASASACGDLLAIDRLDHVESLDRLVRLVALQRADEMQFDGFADRCGASAQVRPFGLRLLHPILAEHDLPAVADRRPYRVGGEGLGDRHQRDVLGSCARSRGRGGRAPRAGLRAARPPYLPQSPWPRLRLTLRAPSPIEPRP